MQNDVDFLAFTAILIDDLDDFAEEVLDIEALERMGVVLIVELDRPCSEAVVVSGTPGWIISGSTGVAGISLTWGWGPGPGLMVTREEGRGEASLMSALLRTLSLLPHAISRFLSTHLLFHTYSGPLEFSLEHLDGDPGPMVTSPGWILDRVTTVPMPLTTIPLSPSRSKFCL